MTQNTTCFLSYAREDLESAQLLYNILTSAGATVWFDEQSLKPGEKWQPAIRRAIQGSRYFLALLSSNSISKKGYVQRELRDALEILDEYPDDEIYLIPARIDPCKPSQDKLTELNWVDLFPDFAGGASRIIRFLGLSQADSTNDMQASLLRDDSDDFSIIRYNGIYQSERQNDYWYNLRFYNDGIVIAVSSTGQAEQIVRWFNKENKNDFSSGDYKIVGKEISFTISSAHGKVDYVGNIIGDRLIMKTHSHINGYRGVRDYMFVKVTLE